jgi:hypothetical protein
VLAYQLREEGEEYSLVLFCEGSESCLEDRLEGWAEEFVWIVYEALCGFVRQAEAGSRVPGLSSRCVLLDPLLVIDSSVIKHPRFQATQPTGHQLLSTMLELTLGRKLDAPLTRPFLESALPLLAGKYSSQLVALIKTIADGKLPLSPSRPQPQPQPNPNPKRNPMHRHARMYLSGTRKVAPAVR